MTDKFSFFRSFYEAIKDFPADDYKEAMNAILAYAFDEEDPEELSLLAGTFFKLTKPNIDASVKASDSGKRGGSKHPSDSSEKTSKHPSGTSGKNTKHPSDDSRESSKHPSDDFQENAKHPSDDCASNKERDKEYGIGNMDNGEGSMDGGEGNGSGRVDYKSVINAFNDTCVSFPRVTSMCAKRKAAIRARLRMHSMADLQEAFAKAEASDFLKGSNARNWSANFDWIMNDNNMAKILDGNYDNKEPAKTAATPQNKFHNFDQRSQDFSVIQARLLQKQAAMEDSG